MWQRVRDYSHEFVQSDDATDVECGFAVEESWFKDEDLPKLKAVVKCLSCVKQVDATAEDPNQPTGVLYCRLLDHCYETLKALAVEHDPAVRLAPAQR